MWLVKKWFFSHLYLFNEKCTWDLSQAISIHHHCIVFKKIIDFRRYFLVSNFSREKSKVVKAGPFKKGTSCDISFALDSFKRIILPSYVEIILIVKKNFKIPFLLFLVVLFYCIRIMLEYFFVEGRVLKSLRAKHYVEIRGWKNAIKSILEGLSEEDG